jgi:hypothetical protein
MAKDFIVENSKAIIKQKARLDWICLKKVTIKIEEKNPKKS